MLDLFAELSPASSQALEFAAKSKAANTRITYESAWHMFEAWCEGLHINPLAGDPRTIANYIAHRAEDLSASAIGVALAAIKHEHDNAGVSLDMRDPFLTSVVAGIRRTIGGQPKRKAVAAVPSVLRSLLAGCAGGSQAKTARDRAMLLLGFGAALRRSELVDLKICDVSIEAGRGLTVLIRRSKTDQFGVGRVVPVAENPLDPEFCPVAAMVRWLQHRHSIPANDDSPLFCAMSTHGGRVTGQRLSDQAVVKLIKAAARAAGMPAEAFSGHSLRRGFMTAAAHAGAALPAMMAHAGQKTPTVAIGYIEEASRWIDNPSDLVFRSAGI
jgi:site-specific recombinase XerD